MGIKLDIYHEEVCHNTDSTEVLSPDVDRRLLKRIDKCLLLVMAISYMFQFLDKSALGYVAILGFRQDLGLNGDEFSWANSIYYLGYLVASWPVAMLMVRFPVGKLICCAVFIWGGILMLTAACTNAAALLAVRFFLGVAESPIAPGLGVIVAMWYKRSEQPLRQAAWFLGNQCAGIFGGVAVYGIGSITGIAAWKAVFLIFGAVTMAWSIAILFLLPDAPSNAWFLSKSDRVLAVSRVRENMTGIKSNCFRWYQCREALADAKAWLIVVIQITCTIPNGGVQSFGPIIVNGLGFNTFQTLLLQSASFLPLVLLVIVVTTGSTYISNSRTCFMAFNLVLATVGIVMVRQIAAEHIWTRYAGYCLTNSFAANFPLIMAVYSANIGGFTKMMTVNAMQFIAYCVGNIVGPQLFMAREAPFYESGFLSILISFGVGFLSIMTLRLYLICENRRRDQLGSAVVEPMPDESEDGGFMGKTDKEIVQFRYVY